MKETKDYIKLMNLMKMKSSCYSCGYFREEKREDGSIRNYCNDRDCTVDPLEPECNYD